MTREELFSERLKQARIEKNYTQTELAELLGYSNYTTVSKWESGDSLPRGKELKKLAKLFNLSTDYLLGLSDEKYIVTSKRIEDNGLLRVAAHIDASVTEEEMEDIIRYIEFIKSKHRGQEDE